MWLWEVLIDSLCVAYSRCWSSCNFHVLRGEMTDYTDGVWLIWRERHLAYVTAVSHRKILSDGKVKQ